MHEIQVHYSRVDRCLARSQVTSCAQVWILPKSLQKQSPAVSSHVNSHRRASLPMPPVCFKVQNSDRFLPTWCNLLRFKTVGNLTAHLASCHDPAETGMLKKFSCKFCSKTFRFPAQVRLLWKSLFNLSPLPRSSNTNESTPKRSPSIVSTVAKDSQWSVIWRPILKLTKVLRSVVSNVPNAATLPPLFHF